MEKLASVVGKSVDWLRGLTPDSPHRRPPQIVSAAARSAIQTQARAAAEVVHPSPEPLPGGEISIAEGIMVPRRGEMLRDLPVYGTAQGANGEGAFVINYGGIVDRVARPPALLSNRDAFAIYVEGDSMEPRFEPGDTVVVDPNRPVRPGDDVVIIVESPEPGREPQAYIKRLVRRGAERIIVKQYNPARELEFPAAAVKKLMRVMRSSELL